MQDDYRSKSTSYLQKTWDVLHRYVMEGSVCSELLVKYEKIGRELNRRINRTAFEKKLDEILARYK